MSIGSQIARLRKERRLTQEEFGRIFHVTRQTVSNWENEKNYPDLQTLIQISDQFAVSLDTLLKEDPQMARTIDRERELGTLKRERSVIDFFTGAGTGIVVSCLFSPDSARRTAAIVTGLVLLCVGWYKKAQSDKAIFQYMEKGGPNR